MLFDLYAFLITTLIPWWLITAFLLAGTCWSSSRHHRRLGVPPSCPARCSPSPHAMVTGRIDAMIAASNNIATSCARRWRQCRLPPRQCSALPTLVASHRAAAAVALPVPDLRDSHLERLERASRHGDREVTHANTVIDMLLFAARPIGDVQLGDQRPPVRRGGAAALPFGSQHERDRAAARRVGRFRTARHARCFSARAVPA